MKKISTILACMAMVLMTVSTIFAQPHLTINEPVFDFGFVPQNAKISHTFLLESTGSDTLEITNVKPGCGCTKTPLKKSILAAGENTDLEVIFSTRNYKGKITKSPRITTNMGPRPLSLKFTANVLADPKSSYPIKITPPVFNISRLGDKELKTLEFEIANISDEDLAINIIELPESIFKIDMPKKVKAGKTAKGRIEILGDFVDQEFEKSMTLELGNTAHSRFTIPIKRKIRQLTDKN